MWRIITSLTVTEKKRNALVRYVKCRRDWSNVGPRLELIWQLRNVLNRKPTLAYHVFSNEYCMVAVILRERHRSWRLHNGRTETKFRRRHEQRHTEGAAVTLPFMPLVYRFGNSLIGATVQSGPRRVLLQKRIFHTIRHTCGLFLREGVEIKLPKCQNVWQIVLPVAPLRQIISSPVLWPLSSRATKMVAVRFSV